MEIRQIAGLVCASLDLVLTPKTIKSGFSATGISLFNPNISTDADFVQVVEENAEAVVVNADLDKDEQRRIVCDHTNIGRGEKVVTSEPSTSRSTSVMSAATTSILDKIDPLQAAAPKKLSKRGRKAIESCELTTPENIAVLKEKAAAKTAATAKKPTSEKSGCQSLSEKNNAQYGEPGVYSQLFSCTIRLLGF